jgi:chemotaxis family two-component system sensor kinase Cph1
LLFSIVKKRKDIPFSRIFWLFIAFIMLCGTTHLIDAIIFWWPAYRLSALVKMATGIVSVITVYALYKTIPAIQKLRTVDQLEAQIEERKKAEQEAKHQQVLKQAAEDLMAKKDEFMSIASHELKTPITSVKASLQILQRMAEKNENLQPAAPFVDKAARQVNKLTAIIHELLDVTRIQAGKLELDKTDFNLGELILECVDQCKLDDKEHVFQIDGDKNLLIYADRNRIDQVLCNLLTNAIKYSPGAGLIIVAFEKLENGLVKVSVTDNGIGIPEDKTADIFDRFYRVENRPQYYSGIGLGLFISSEIIKRHGGEIGVESILGKGSTFWFTV